jgi:outer membrane receptor protein involved in Fe transport
MGACSKSRFVRNALLASAAMGCALLAATPSLAQERRTFDIPAESAADAIRTLARQSGLQVLAPAEDVRGVRTNALQGQYEPMDAVHRLFDGTGLEVVQTGSNTVTVRRSSGSPPPAVRASSEGDSTAVEEVTVTGSRIKRAGFDTLEAAFTTDAKQIQDRGYTNAIQALDETPGFVPSGVNPVGTNQSTFGSGQSFADFFGLGSNRTLTLVNGRRYVSSNAASAGNAANPGGSGLQVDLNTIPVGLIDHIETVAIGGAPVYGSDAISGTVNIILKDHFNGMQASAQYGVSDRGDGESQTYRVLVGGDFAEGRGNAVVSAEYAKQDGLLLSSRSGLYYSVPNEYAASPAIAVAKDIGYGAFTEGGLPSLSGFTGLGGDYIFDGSGTPLQFGSNGKLVPYHVGADLVNALYGLPMGVPFENDGGDGTHFSDHTGLLAPTERILLNGNAHFDLTPHIRAFVESSYAHSQGDEMSEVAAFISPLAGGNFLPFSIDNPYLDPADRATLIANGVTDTFQLSRNLSDLLDSPGYLERTTIDLYRIVGGFQGDFQAMGEKWNWDLSYDYGRSQATTVSNYVNGDRLLLAADAVTDASGNIVCRSGGACVPIDLFGQNRFSPAAAKYVLDPTQAINTNTEKVLTANLAGNLPFGVSPQHIAVNIGAEYREEQGAFRPDAALLAGSNLLGLSLAGSYDGIDGGFNTKEVYGETVVPLVVDEQNWPLIKNLSFEGAVRYVDNSISGGATTWSAGGRFAPRLGTWADGLVLRGVYMRAIRAPAIPELFSGAASTRGSIGDPCDPSLVNTGNNPAVRAANCAAALAALGYADPSTFHSTTGTLSPVGTVSGNPNLDNETSKSWSLGFVWQPVVVPHLRLSADWNDIKLTGGIQSLDINQILSACYDSPSYPNLPACQSTAFRRLSGSEVGAGTSNPTRVAGDIADGYNTGFINTASLEFAGAIFAAQYDFDLGSLNSNWAENGNIRLGAKLFYTDKYDTVDFDGEPVIHHKGNVGAPEFSGQFTAGWTWNKLDITTQAQWTSSTKNDITADNTILADHYNDVASYWKFSGSIGYRLTPNVRAQITVNNILNKGLSDAQLLSHAYGTYDLIGRSYLFNLTATF